MVWNGGLVTQVNYMLVPSLNTLCHVCASYMLVPPLDMLCLPCMFISWGDSEERETDLDSYVHTVFTEALLAVVKGRCLGVCPSAEGWVDQVYARSQWKVAHP